MEKKQMYLLYDDHCKFCSAIARWTVSQNPAIAVWSVRSSDAKDLLKLHGIHFIDLQTVYFVECAVHVRSRAAFQLLQHTHRPWRWLSILRYLPLLLTDACYNFIARNRYRLNRKCGYSRAL